MFTRQYEMVFILTPVLSDQQMKDTVDKFRKILTDNGAELVHEENWGLKKLAYPIQNKNTGFYHLIEFKSQPTLIQTIEINQWRCRDVLHLDDNARRWRRRERCGPLSLDP